LMNLVNDDEAHTDLISNNVFKTDELPFQISCKIIAKILNLAPI
jgi:hypothetical protein